MRRLLTAALLSAIFCSAICHASRKGKPFKEGRSTNSGQKVPADSILDKELEDLANLQPMQRMVEEKEDDNQGEWHTVTRSNRKRNAPPKKMGGNVVADSAFVPPPQTRSKTKHATTVNSNRSTLASEKPGNWPRGHRQAAFKSHRSSVKVKEKQTQVPVVVRQPIPVHVQQKQLSDAIHESIQGKANEEEEEEESEETEKEEEQYGDEDDSDLMSHASQKPQKIIYYTPQHVIESFRMNLTKQLEKGIQYQNHIQLSELDLLINNFRSIPALCLSEQQASSILDTIRFAEGRFRNDLSFEIHVRFFIIESILIEAVNRHLDVLSTSVVILHSNPVTSRLISALNEWPSAQQEEFLKRIVATKQIAPKNVPQFISDLFDQRSGIFVWKVVSGYISDSKDITLLGRIAVVCAKMARNNFTPQDDHYKAELFRLALRRLAALLFPGYQNLHNHLTNASLTKLISLNSLDDAYTTTDTLAKSSSSMRSLVKSPSDLWLRNLCNNPSTSSCSFVDSDIVAEANSIIDRFSPDYMDELVDDIPEKAVPLKSASFDEESPMAKQRRGGPSPAQMLAMEEIQRTNNDTLWMRDIWKALLTDNPTLETWSPSRPKGNGAMYRWEVFFEVISDVHLVAPMAPALQEQHNFSNYERSMMTRSLQNALSYSDGLFYLIVSSMNRTSTPTSNIEAFIVELLTKQLYGKDGVLYAKRYIVSLNILLSLASRYYHDRMRDAGFTDPHSRDLFSLPARHFECVHAILATSLQVLSIRGSKHNSSDNPTIMMTTQPRAVQDLDPLVADLNLPYVALAWVHYRLAFSHEAAITHSNLHGTGSRNPVRVSNPWVYAIMSTAFPQYQYQPMYASQAIMRDLVSFGTFVHSIASSNDPVRMMYSPQTSTTSQGKQDNSTNIMVLVREIWSQQPVRSLKIYAFTSLLHMCADRLPMAVIIRAFQEYAEENQTDSDEIYDILVGSLTNLLGVDSAIFDFESV